jgi:hypothetical protein
MKKLLASTFLVVVLTSLGQNVLVNFSPDNSPYIGLTNYPATTTYVSWATNTPGYATNMTVAQYATYIGTYQVAYSNGILNAVSNANLNYTLLSATLSQLQAGINDSSNRVRTVTNLYTAWITGTNAAGTNYLISQLFQQLQYSFVYHQGEVTLFSRLSTFITNNYNPYTDAIAP